MPLSDAAPVLIVDDDDLVRGILRKRLEYQGIPVMDVASAEEALAAVETTRVGTLVLDIHMPGQSGLALAEFIRLFGMHLTGVPILIFTGGTLTPEIVELARRYDADVFLKPDGLASLLQRISVLAHPVNQLLRMERPGSTSHTNFVADDEPNDYREPES
jgi:DNA-binding response OmpR family regulator